MDRARIALKYADAVESLRVAHNVLHEAEIMGIEATSDHATLVERKRSVKDLLTAKEIEVQEFTREVERSHATSKALLKKVQEIMANDSDDTLRTFFMSLSPEQTVEELDSEIESEKARLELMHEGNGNTIREFEQRRRKIEALASRLAQIKTTLAEMEAGISTLRGKWEPELDGLVKRISDSFSYNMEQISCAGEVSIWKDDDFEQWAIQIRVKFRYALPVFLRLQPLFLRPPNPLLSPTPACLFADHNDQRKRTPNNSNLPPPIRRRTRRLHNLLPHVPPIAHALPLPRRRRNKPGHGPPKRAPRAQTHGRHRLRHSHYHHHNHLNIANPPRPHHRPRAPRVRRQPILPHHAQTPARPLLRPRHAGHVHRVR